MRIIMLGAPGAGKGTQAQYISDHFKIPNISTGDILRRAIAESSPIGQVVKQIVLEGQLVPDDLMIQLIEKRIAEDDCKQGFLLDGFPRTRHQAEAFKAKGIEIDTVITFEVPDEVIIERLGGRRIHPASGRVYHIQHNPPKVENKDDVSGEDLVQREDDKPETIRKRLAVYHEQTEPLIQWYQNGPYRFIRIQGTDSVDAIRKLLKEALS